MHLRAQVDRALDRRRITPNPLTPSFQRLCLAAGGIGVPEEVPDVGVPGDDPQHHLLAGAADQDRDLLLHRRRIEPLHACDDALEGGFEIGETLAGRAEGIPVLTKLGVVPTRADPQHEAAGGDVVDRPRHVREQIRIAEGIARHEAPDTRPAGHLGHRCQQGIALQVPTSRVARGRDQVIPVVDHVHAQFLGIEPHLPVVGIGRVLLSDLQGNGDGTTWRRRDGHRRLLLRVGRRCESTLLRRMGRAADDEGSASDDSRR